MSHPNPRASVSPGAAAHPRGGRIDVPPRWSCTVPGHGPVVGRTQIILQPGAGFGDGGHATTQLCLQAMAAYAQRTGPWRMLDVGSGSGVLAIAAAKLGAQVDAIEVDAAAMANAEHNCGLNGVQAQVRLRPSLDGSAGPFALVVANIVRPVLLDLAPQLCARLAPQGTLVLSGILATEVPEVSARYAAQLRAWRPEVVSLDEWRALAWRPPSA